MVNIDPGAARKPMKPALFASIAVMLLGIAAWSLVGTLKTTPCSRTAMKGSIIDICCTVGLERTGYTALRRSRSPTISGWFNTILGRPMACDFIDHYTLQDGAAFIRLDATHSGGNVKSVTIRPDAMPSKKAEALKTGLITRYPYLDCRVVGP